MESRVLNDTLPESGGPRGSWSGLHPSANTSEWSYMCTVGPGCAEENLTLLTPPGAHSFLTMALLTLEAG